MVRAMRAFCCEGGAASRKTEPMTRRAAALFLSIFLGSAPAAAEILIATAGPMSGPNAPFGEEMRRGVKRAIDDINATGGLRGERLAMVEADDGCDPRKAVDVATNFVSKGVKLVAGHFCSGASIPASKIYEQAGIVQISPASTNPKFTDEGGWNVFRAAASDDAQGTAAGRYIVAHYRDRKIALLSDKSPAGTALVAAARESLASAGLPPAADETFTPGAKDYSQLARSLHDKTIDVVYLGGTYVEGGLIIRALRDLGSEAQLIASDALVTDEFWNIAREAGEGTLMTFAPDQQKFETAKPLVRRFTEDGYNPEGHTLNAYAAVQAYVQAAEAAGGTDPHRIAQWLRAGNRVSTVLGEIAFDAKGNLRDPRFTWFRWVDGKFVEDPAIQ